MNAILEFQHSQMTCLEFNARNTGCAKATWIFDATELPLYCYGLNDNYFFVKDKWREMFPQSDSVKVLFHCRDKQLYAAACDRVIQLSTEHPQSQEASKQPLHLYARLLQRCGEAEQRAIIFFCGSAWPPAIWKGKPLQYPQAADVLRIPVRILGAHGRLEIDRIHRQGFRVFPSSTETVYLAPPGSGKTTEIVEAIKAWQGKRVLVLTFNKSTSLTMNERLRKEGLNSRSEAKTLDALCFRACKPTEGYDFDFNDKEFLRLAFPRRCGSKKGFWSKYNSGGGRGSAALVQFRLRHPHGQFTPCGFHQLLCDRRWWDSLNQWPIKEVVKRKFCPATLRYRCDRDQLLMQIIDSQWDAIIVDEVQDLLGAQELRLLRQTSKPIVLVGDMMFFATYELLFTIPRLRRHSRSGRKLGHSEGYSRTGVNAKL